MNQTPGITLSSSVAGLWLLLGLVNFCPVGVYTLICSFFLCVCLCRTDFNEANFGGFMKKKCPRSSKEEAYDEEEVRSVFKLASFDVY